MCFALACALQHVLCGMQLVLCTFKEIEAIVAFWWELQTYRRRYLERQNRVDTAEEVLSEEDIMKVKRDWENYEIRRPSSACRTESSSKSCL